MVNRANAQNIVSDKYDVGLVTFYFVNNYGAILTAFSLYDYLRNKGYKTVIVPKPTFWWKDLTPDLTPLSVDFYKNHAEFTKVYDRDTIDELDSICNNFIVGSDQLWNPSLYFNAGYYTFLGFSNKSKRISYSTSFGKDRFTDDIRYVEEAKRYLKRFDGISLREKSGVDLCNNIFGLDAVWNLDAVFLTTKERYLEIASESKVEKPNRYLFAYILDPTPYKDELIKAIAKEKQLEYVMVTDGGRVAADEEINTELEVKKTVSVQDWLSYVADSDFIITDSFHGACFSIIFEKQFISIKNRGITRMESLMNQFGLDRYIIPSRFKLSGELIKSYTRLIDWDVINKKKCELIEFSSSWLVSKINDTKTELRQTFKRDVPLLTDVTELGLSYPVAIETIITKLPRNTTIVLPIDKKEKTVINIPESFGILTIKKTSDHYVDIHFVKTVEQNSPIKVFVGKWLDGTVGKWVRMLTTDDLESLQRRLITLENRIK